MTRIMGAPTEVKVVNVRLVKEPSLYSTEPIQTPQDVLEVVAKELATYDREVFAILNLKSNGQSINMNICRVGTLNASMVRPADCFKGSILSNASKLVAVHNHPSGNTQPSQEDMEVTKRLAAAGELLNIELLDHIIVGGETGEIFSFRSEGLLDRNARDMER